MSTLAPSRSSVKAVVHAADEGGYWAEVPELPGCFTQGESLDEVYRNLIEAVALHQDVPDEKVHILTQPRHANGIRGWTW